MKVVWELWVVDRPRPKLRLRPLSYVVIFSKLFPALEFGETYEYGKFWQFWQKYLKSCADQNSQINRHFTRYRKLGVFQSSSWIWKLMGVWFRKLKITFSLQHCKFWYFWPKQFRSCAHWNSKCTVTINFFQNFSWFGSSVKTLGVTFSLHKVKFWQQFFAIPPNFQPHPHGTNFHPNFSYESNGAAQIVRFPPPAKITLSPTQNSKKYVTKMIEEEQPKANDRRRL